MNDMGQVGSNELLNLHTGLIIHQSQYKVIDQLLIDLAHICPAQFVLLTDTNGQFVSARGDLGGLDLVALSSLVASDIAASSEIARIIGQYQKTQLVLREGELINTFIVEAGSYLVLFVQVSSTLPLGWARMLIMETSRKLAAAISMLPEKVPELKLGVRGEKLNNAVDDALDSLWTG